MKRNGKDLEEEWHTWKHLERMSSDKGNGGLWSVDYTLIGVASSDVDEA